MTQIVAAETKFGALLLTLEGTLDFNKHVFQNLQSGNWNEAQAENLWKYTDGYKFKITGEYKATTSAIHCVMKTAVLADSNGRASGSGAICFSSTNGVISKLEYRNSPNDDTANLWTGSVDANYASENAWNSSNNAYKAFVTNNWNIAPTEQVAWTLYQPKWQADDLYYNNFRINKEDTVQAFYNDAGVAVNKVGTAVKIVTGAATLVAGAGMAALMLF